MTRGDAPSAVLFLDLADSTALYTSLGDEAARTRIANAFERLETIVDDQAGRVVKSIGDELLCVLPTADAAAVAAILMNGALDGISAGAGPELNSHVGIHYGPLVEAGGDVFGDVVNVAARLVKLAKPRQILASGDLVSSLSDPVARWSRFLHRTRVKGRSQPIDVHEILWEVGEETDVLVSLAVSRPPAPRLRLRAGACEVFVEDERPSVRLGRQPHNDLVVEGRGVSRTHARVELRHGHFVLIDESTNGCLVRAEGKAAIHVRHDEIRLSARGSIALGGDPQPAGENVVDYERLEASGGDRGA